MVYGTQYQCCSNFSEVRAYYAAVVSNNIKKCPFDDDVLKDLVVVDFSKRADLTYAPRMSWLSTSQSELI